MSTSETAHERIARELFQYWNFKPDITDPAQRAEEAWLEAGRRLAALEERARLKAERLAIARRVFQRLGGPR